VSALIPIAIPFYFSLAGRFFEFGMGDGARSGFFKEEAAEFKMQTQSVPAVIISY